MRISATHKNEATRRDSDETMDCGAWHDAAYANAGDGARRDGFHLGTAGGRLNRWGDGKKNMARQTAK